jgi:hypothetical protein
VPSSLDVRLPNWVLASNTTAGAWSCLYIPRSYLTHTVDGQLAIDAGNIENGIILTRESLETLKTHMVDREPGPLQRGPPPQDGEIWGNTTAAIGSFRLHHEVSLRNPMQFWMLLRGQSCLLFAIEDSALRPNRSELIR